MAYIKTTWKDRIVENPGTYTLQQNANGAVTLVPAFGEVTEAGVPVNAANLNNLENGIAAIDSQMADITNNQLPLKANKTDLDTLNNQMITKPSTTTADITYYINASTGNDSNNGLTSGTAFKTIQHAIGLLPSIINNAIKIYIAAGTYSGTISLAKFYGAGGISILGDSNNSANYIVGTVSISNVECNVSIVGLKIDLLLVSSVLNFDINACTIITSTSYGIQASYSNGSIENSVISNKTSAIQSMFNSNIISSNNSGSNNSISLDSRYNSTIGKAGTQPTGTTSEYTNAGGVIR